MTTVIALAVIVIALVWLVDRKDRRYRDERLEDRQAVAPDLVALIALVDRLCQRIQAPTAAVQDHSLAQGVAMSPPAVPLDDDAAYWASRLTKEQLADAMMDEELAERVTS